jgi:NTE family protein
MSAGLVLSGGGATGAYEVGVLKALLLGHAPVTGRRPLHVKSIAATSIGTFNASLLLSHHDGRAWDGAVAALESTWVDKISASRAISPNGVFRYRPNFLEWMNPAEWMRPWGPASLFATDASYIARDMMARVSGLVSGSGGLAHRFAELIDISTFITPDPSAQLVKASLVPHRIRESTVCLRVTATQWQNGTLRVFENRDFTDDRAVDIVRASGAIPGFFPSVTIDGQPYVDGGIVLNTPLKPAIDAGANELHVVYLDPAPGAVPLRAVGSTVDTMGRMFVASFAATMRRDIDVARQTNRDVAAGHRGHKPAHRQITIHLYHPKEDTGGALGMLDFGRGRIVQLAEQGYRDAVAHDCAAQGCLNAGVDIPDPRRI